MASGSGFSEKTERGFKQDEKHIWNNTHGYETKHDIFHQWLGAFPHLTAYLDGDLGKTFSKQFYLCYSEDKDADWRELHTRFLSILKSFPPNDSFDSDRLERLLGELNSAPHISLLISFEILRFVDVFLEERTVLQKRAR